MLANINDVFLFCNFIANKNQSGSISGDEFNIAINVAQQQYFRLKLGLPEVYTVKEREAPQEIQVTQNISDALRNFIVSTPVSKTGNGFSIPSDFAAFVPSSYLYVSLVNGETVAENQPIDFVTSGERAQRRNNSITYPDLEYPIATYLNGQIIVDPSDISQIELTYYKYPVTPVFGFTVNSNDQIEYNPATSVQLSFPNLDWENIAHIALKYWAQFLREEFLYQTEDKRIVTGQ